MNVTPSRLVEFTSTMRKEAAGVRAQKRWYPYINPKNPELNPICYLLALLGAHHFLHVSRIRVKSLTLR